MNNGLRRFLKMYLKCALNYWKKLLRVTSYGKVVRWLPFRSCPKKNSFLASNNIKIR